MYKILAGAVAAGAIVSLAAAAHAEKVCQWTGVDWACGDGNVVTSHYSEAAGPPTTIVAVPTVTPTGPGAHRFDEPRPQ
ncbi:MAG TPA: hypothetical protein VG308_19800 [Stellaceae bacterium]|jgi:hypothetical protein|nr:hypothetical protein [Stellaceae bacterium]